jgi:hypothetical protein
LRGEAFAHLGHRVALLHLLVGVAPFVRDFYDKFRHSLFFLLLIRRATLSDQSNIAGFDPEQPSQ